MGLSRRDLLIGVLAAGAAPGAIAMAKGLDPTRIRRAVSDAHERYKNLNEGHNADYIPALKNVDPTLFGIAWVSLDGAVIASGDSERVFAIESISKMLTLSLVLGRLGAADVLDKIGAEPTGLPFNSVLAIEQEPGHTVNPFVNAGAIATSSLVGGPQKERWPSLLAYYSRFAGRPLALMDDVFRSESQTNTHNQAIALLIQSYGRLYGDPSAALDLYTRQCSVGVTAVDLAMAGAVLANRGRHPRTGETLLSVSLVPRVLSVMSMAGLYNRSGTWAYTVGLPSKSGVGGGIVAVIPGVGGLAAFSPPLDDAGNSVRSQRAIADIADELGLNIYASHARD